MARTSGALLEPGLPAVLFEGGASLAATQQVPAGPQQQAAAPPGVVTALGLLKINTCRPVNLVRHIKAGYLPTSDIREPG